MMNVKPFFTKFLQRETWLYLAGVGLSIATFVLEAHGNLENFNPMEMSPIIGTLLGGGAYAHVKRGQQRGEEVVATAKKVWEGRKAPQTDDGDEEEGPWD